MAAWTHHRGVGLGAFVLGLVGFVVAPPSALAAPWPTSPLWGQLEAAAEPVAPNRPAPSEKLTPAELRERAAAAEQAGDWEAAFTAYRELNVAERAAPGVRNKLNTAL